MLGYQLKSLWPTSECLISSPTPASHQCSSREAATVAQVPGLLPPLWETRVKFLALDFRPGPSGWQASITCCLPGTTLAGHWNCKQSWDLNLGVLMWDVGIPRGALTTVPRGCPVRGGL